MNAPAKPKARILIVEDDSVLASVEEWRLKKMGYDICGHAASGKDAIALIKKDSPDLVLLDINLEGDIDGIQIGQFLDAETSIPFIFLSAHGEDEILKRVKGTLQYGYIKKPFNEDNLRIAIDLALSKSRFINRILADNALFETAFNQFPLGIIITDNDGLILYANASARAMTQWQDAVGSTHFWEILRVTAQERPVEDLLERVKKESSTVWLPKDSILTAMNDRLVPVTGTITPLVNDKGAREGVIISLLSLSSDRKYFRTR